MEGGCERHTLLPGQRFCPMEDELLMHYLNPKVNGKEVPGQETLISELDLYGDEEPWNTWKRFEKDRANDLRRNKDLYFFTRLKKVSAKGSRICRKVGKGTWKGQDKAKKIYLVDQKQQQTKTLLGSRKTYTYKNTGSEHHGRWIMYEYELDESQFLHKKQVNKNEYVLCLIRKNDILPEKKRKRQEEEDDQVLEDYAEDDDDGDNMKPETVIEEPQEKRQRDLPCTDNVPAPSLDPVAEVDQWFNSEYYQPAPPLEAYNLAEPQPSEGYLGKQCQMTMYSDNNIMTGHNNFHQDKNQVQQRGAEEGFMTPGEVGLYGEDLNYVMDDANWPSYDIEELKQLLHNDQQQLSAMDVGDQSNDNS
ncbi:hypothetical protein ACLB2K_028862 [Fragaria x ananassa]